MSKHKIRDPRTFPDASQFDPRKHEMGVEAGRVNYGTGPQVYDNLRKRGWLGPVDPITGAIESSAASESEILKENTFQDNHLEILRHQLSQHERLIAAVRALSPISQALVDGGSGAVFVTNANQRGAGFVITNTEPREFRFTVDGKRVPALKIIIQNNSADTIFCNFGNGATPGTFQVLAGAVAYLEVVIESLWLLTKATTSMQVNGIVSNGVYIAAWSNPEWTHVHGQV